MLPSLLAPHRSLLTTAILVLAGAAPLRQADGQTATARDLVVVVTDAVAGHPVEAALVQLRGTSGGARTDRDGHARLARPSAPNAQLEVRRIGYSPRLVTIPRASDTLRVSLSVAAVELEALRIDGGARGTLTAALPITVLEGDALDQRLSASIAATLAGEPGITQRTNGPMATAPVIRGLSGDRITVLEDGLRMGDIATTAPDHAITADPLTAQRLEVIRGPAGLLFGSNTLGGVINVVRDDVPRELLRGFRANAATQVESMNAGRSLSGDVHAGAGTAVIRASGSLRRGDDARTPQGRLSFTDVQQTEASVGASLIGTQGFVGAAVRHFDTNYGVPGSFRGLTLPGAHDGGVYVRGERTSLRVAGEWRPASTGVTAIAATGNAIRFAQDEFEQGGFIGTRFGQLSASGDVVARFAHGGPLRGNGAVGLWGQVRDFRTEGSFTGSRPATSHASALYVYDELRWGRLRLIGGARLDVVTIRPLDSTETRLLRGVRTRAFTAPTGSLAVQHDLHSGFSAGVSVANSFRAPAIEELYSAGPHLANYAYEVGDPDLRAERGMGTDVYVRLTRPRVYAELSAFRNRINEFITFAPMTDAVTGEPMRDPRLRRYIVYRPLQADAILLGAEGRGRWHATPHTTIDLTGSYVRGTMVQDGAPVPAMPPLRMRAGLQRDAIGPFHVGVGADWIAAQRRVPAATADGTATCTIREVAGEAVGLPAEFCPTGGAVLLDLTAGVRFTAGGRGHAIMLVVDNALDRVWRDHLWRAKAVAPQPGRNMRAVYRMQW
jgi:iron complex outermembrane receptor protein